MEDAYDLKRVTVTLEAMEARRRRRQQQFPVTRDFELAPAELSSGGSDSDSDQSDSTSSLASDGDGSPSRVKPQHGRGRTRKTRLMDSLDLSMSVSSKEPSTAVEERRIGIRPKVQDEEHALTQDKHLKLDTISKVSKIPRLVQQRRQLRAVPERTILTRGEISHQTRPSHVNEFVREVLSSSDAKALLHRPISRLPSSRTDAPEEFFTVGESMMDLPSAVSNVATVPETPNSGSLFSGSVSVSESLAQASTLHRAKAPTFGAAKSSQSNFSKKLDGGNTSTVGSAYDELDSTSAEERRLLQSLENLDRRLTSVSAVPPVVVRGGGQSDQVHRLVSSNTEGSRLVHAADGEIDEETLRAAAYGGGTHCKLRQPAAVSVRSSSVKRAELSTGIHKSRVRSGGAFIHDTGRNADGTGKHKVVVKKDLAHLLI